MKKKIGLALLSFLLVFTLAACGGAANNTAKEDSSKATNSSQAPAESELKPEPDAKLVFWHPKTPFSELAVKEFEKKYNIPVTLQDIGYGDIMKKYKADGPAGKGGDVIVLGHVDVGDAVRSGSVLPNDYFEEETKSMMLEDAVRSMTWDNILYGYPSYAYLPALFVNKNLVKDAKLETWDDIKAFAKTFNDIPNNKYGFMFEANGWGNAYPFLAGQGGYIFGKNGTDVNDIGLNSEGAVKGAEFYRSLKDILPLKAADTSGDVKRSLWEQGKVAIIMDGAWNSNNFKKLSFPVAVIPLPKMPDGNYPKVRVGVGGFLVGSYTKYPNAAKLLANFLASEEMQLKIHELTGFIPLAKSLQNEDRFKGDEVTQGFIRQMKHTEFSPNVPEMQYIEYNDHVLSPAFEQIWNGADIKQSLDKAVQNLKDTIASGKK